MGTLRPFQVLLTCLALFTLSIQAQEISTYRVLNLTLNTLSPSDLRINRGRLIWKDLDGGGAYYLQYYSGAEITAIDSGLTDVRHAIDGDYIVWNTPSKVVKAFNTRTWLTDTIASNAYYPARLLSVSVSNGLAAFAADKVASGSEIRLRKLASGTDSVFSAALWNREPSVCFGQLAWSASASEDTLAGSSIMFYDGKTTRTISDSNAVPNRDPILRDGGIVWLQHGSNPRVKAYVGDSLLTVAEANSQSIIAGYDISDGVVVGALTDTVNAVSTLRIYRPSTGAITVVTDSNLIQPPHIDNGQVVWVLGTGGGRVMRLYSVEGGGVTDLGIADYPVIDDDEIAWTLGDAVEMRVPVTYEKLTSDAVNGSAQRRFHMIERGNILWGNFADAVLPQRTSPRLFYAGAGPTTQLTDSLVYKDFEMVNSGYAVWRLDFNQLWLYDGSTTPVRVIDSLQCENMYVADSSIGFHGFRTNAGNSFNQAWIYRIGLDTLIQLTNDASLDTTNGTTLVDGNAAVWYRTEGEDIMLMYYDGLTKTRMTDSLVGFRFSFVDGVIAWSERRNGVYQIMMKNTSGGGTVQLTNGTGDATDPVTDGLNIAWFEKNVSDPTLVYYNIASGKETKVARVAPEVAHWMWLSNGRVAWSQGNEARVFDGSVVSQLTGSGDSTPNTDVYVDNETMVWKQRSISPGIPPLGDIFRGRLRPFASFDAVNVRGSVPLAVTFANRSWQGARSYSWDFGDGTGSTSPNPVHSYSTPGVYSVTLTVSGLTGQAVEKKWKLVRATAVTDAAVETNPQPAAFALHQNFPNPFNPETAFSYQLSAVSNVKLRVYDLLGRVVATIVDEMLPAGVHRATWDASGFPSGVYFLQMEAGPSTPSGNTGQAGSGFRAMRKLVLVR